MLKELRKIRQINHLQGVFDSVAHLGGPHCFWDYRIGFFVAPKTTKKSLADLLCQALVMILMLIINYYQEDAGWNPLPGIYDY